MHRYYYHPAGDPSDAMAMVEENRRLAAGNGGGDAGEEGRPETEFGRQFLETLGIRTTRGGQDDPRRREEAVFYGQEPPEDVWERQSGHQRRELLSDWVRKDDPRRFREGSWDPREGYLFDVDGGDDDDGGGILGGGPGAMNLDGFLGLSDMNDPEMRQALAYQAQSPVGELKRRFDAAQRRALEHEAAEESFPPSGEDWAMPTETARKLTRDPHRVLRVFDPDIRIRDTQRALQFYRSQPDAIAVLSKAVDTAASFHRGQYGDFLSDILRRIKRTQERTHSAPPQAQTPRRKHSAKEFPPLQPNRVGHVTNGKNPAWSRAPRNYAHAPPRTFSPLDVPVFSRAWWTVSSGSPSSAPHAPSMVFAAAYDEDGEEPYQQLPAKQSVHTERPKKAGPPSYFERGNVHFLVARLGLVSGKARKRAEQDAVQFFVRRFGLDFTPKSGAKQDPQTLAIHHATLPLILEPYTVSGTLHSQVELSEGNLGSTTTASDTDSEASPSAGKDVLGNGLRDYRKEGSGMRTSVAEAGWIVRNNSKRAVALPVKQSKGRVAKKGIMLPRGGLLATGFWVLERPDAPPVLLRFQSARPPQVTARRLAVPGGGRKKTEPRAAGIRHEIVSRWDVYDMAHDSSVRPHKGVGQGISVLCLDWLRDAGGGIKHKTETSRTMITIHH